MDMGGTESEAVVKKSGVNYSPTFCSFQQITQVTQMSVTSSNPVPGTVLIQDKHLAWTEPSLHNINTNGGCITVHQLAKAAHCHNCIKWWHNEERDTHQAAEGVIEPVVQRESLHHLKKRGVVKATGVSGDKLIHAMFLSSVSVYPANSTGKSTRFRGEDIS